MYRTERTVNTLSSKENNRFPEQRQKLLARVKRYFTMKSLILAQDER